WRYLWQQTRGDAHEAFPNQGEAVQSVAISPNGDLVAVGSDHKLNVWRVRDKSLAHTSAQGATSLRFMPDGKSLIVASGGSRGFEMRGPDGPRGPDARRSSGVRVLSTADWTEQRILNGASGPLSLSLNDGSHLATQGRDGVR